MSDDPLIPRRALVPHEPPAPAELLIETLRLVQDRVSPEWNLEQERQGEQALLQVMELPLMHVMSRHEGLHLTAEELLPLAREIYEAQREGKYDGHVTLPEEGGDTPQGRRKGSLIDAIRLLLIRQVTGEQERLLAEAAVIARDMQDPELPADFRALRARVLKDKDADEGVDVLRALNAGLARWNARYATVAPHAAQAMQGPAQRIALLMQEAVNNPEEARKGGEAKRLFEAEVKNIRQKAGQEAGKREEAFAYKLHQAVDKLGLTRQVRRQAAHAILGANLA